MKNYCLTQFSDILQNSLYELTKIYFRDRAHSII